jgi:hypothetical protein
MLKAFQWYLIAALTIGSIVGVFSDWMTGHIAAHRAIIAIAILSVVWTLVIIGLRRTTDHNQPTQSS